jgi:hypothetical protein
MYHIDRKKFKSVDEVVNYLGKSEGPTAIEKEMGDQELESARKMIETEEEEEEEEFMDDDMDMDNEEQEEEEFYASSGRTRHRIEDFSKFEDEDDFDEESFTGEQEGERRIGMDDEFEGDFEEEGEFEDDFERDSDIECEEDCPECGNCPCTCHEEEVDDTEMDRNFQGFGLKDDRIKWPREEEAMESHVTKRFKDFR